MADPIDSMSVRLIRTGSPSGTPLRWHGMDDVLSGLLQDIRAHGALFDQSALAPPWSVRFGDGAPLSLLTMVRGDAWLTSGGEEAVPLRQGDVAILVGPQPCDVADAPGRAPMVFQHTGNHCTAPDGTPVTADDLAMCTDLDDPEAGAVLLRSAYPVQGQVCDRVLAALPRLALVPAAPRRPLPLAMIEAELRKDVPGRQVILDRLLDLLLLSTLRDWFDRPESHAPAWYRAHRDPAVGRALKLIHGDLARPWTVASLAAEAGMSRARFAQRFHDLLGQPPMAYLTEWRICRAADLLAGTDATADAISRQVGYANAYALSVAFKRTLGIRPTEHRALARAGATPTTAPVHQP